MVAQKSRAHPRLLVELSLQLLVSTFPIWGSPHHGHWITPTGEMAHHLLKPRLIMVENYLVGKAKEFGLRQVSKRQTPKFEKWHLTSNSQKKPLCNAEIPVWFLPNFHLGFTYPLLKCYVSAICMLQSVPATPSALSSFPCWWLVFILRTHSPTKIKSMQAKVEGWDVVLTQYRWPRKEKLICLKSQSISGKTETKLQQNPA